MGKQKMTAKVTYAFGAAPPDERQKKVLKVLEEALEMAASGRIRGIAVTMVDQVGDPFCNYSAERWVELLGAIERLRHHVNKDIDIAIVTDASA